MISICLASFTANFGEKISTKSAYLLGTLVGTLSIFRFAIWAFFKGCILSPKSISKIATCIIKTLYFRSKTIATNFFFPISLTYLVVKSISFVV